MEELYARCIKRVEHHMQENSISLDIGIWDPSVDDTLGDAMRRYTRGIVEVICKEIIVAAVEKRVLKDGKLDVKTADDAATKPAPAVTEPERQALLDEEAARAKSPPLAPSHAGNHPSARPTGGDATG